MQKIPAILAVRQKQSKSNSKTTPDREKKSGTCALLSPKKNSQRLYNNVVDDE